jgi:hypothetical protein
MLIIIQICAFLVGLSSLVSGWTLMTREYRVPKVRARVAGLLLVLILPAAFTFGLILGVLGVNFEEYALAIIAAEGLLTLVLIGIATRIGYAPATPQPESPADDIAPPDDARETLASP